MWGKTQDLTLCLDPMPAMPVTPMPAGASSTIGQGANAGRDAAADESKPRLQLAKIVLHADGDADTLVELEADSG